LNMFDLKFCAVKLELPLGAIKWHVQCPLCDSVLEEVISLKNTPH
jgi:C4-type Zn-finger protein